MSYLYALQMVIPDYYCPIKIGLSVEPQRRKGNLTRGPFPTRLLGTWKAPHGREDEKIVHVRFAEARLYGEWFRPTDDLLQFLADVIEEKAVEDYSPKVRARVVRFEARMRAAKVPQETQPAPVVPPPSQLMSVDVFSAPDIFLTEHLERIRRRWPSFHGSPVALKQNEVAEITGIPATVIDREMDFLYAHMGKRKPQARHKRYRFHLVKRFLESHREHVPLLLERTA